ncbi:response regulator [Paramagnetospirillum kuznetsovii]|uniref:Response regulator n=1 Tax=Paramagnetospirillum kuznetsovii TaxID=2053833 RepID=A0A364P1H2_9PROT|nr:response regulator [Paramagnetospirillum kuznetsovii]RAU22965.1 response regulator [Paramagnetospirillum kuznetsovii]
MTDMEDLSFLVLLAEDDSGDAHLVKAAFADGSYPCKVEHVWDGVEAMARLNAAKESGARLPDLLLLDINMPKMNGIEVLAMVKADAALRDIPAVMLTTSDAERDVSGAYQAGASGYVSKPVDVEGLFTSIHGISDYWFGVMRRPR